MPRYSIPLAAAALVLAAPGSADAKCGVASSKALYETPQVQVYKTGEEEFSTHRACLRATGRQRTVGQTGGGEGGQSSTLLGVLGRWVWMEHAMTDPDADTRDVGQSLTDLRTGKQASVTTGDGIETSALPGALVTAGGGVIAHFTDGRKLTLSEDPEAAGLAVRGSRVYWRTGDVAHTATLELPKGDPARSGPKATRIKRCAPRKGARLVLWAGELVLTSRGGTTWGCWIFESRTREIGKVSGLTALSYRQVAYTRAGKVGTFDVARGKRTEVAGTAFAASADRLLVVTPEGLRNPVDLLVAAPATEPALAGNFFYWLDGAGAPRLTAM